MRVLFAQGNPGAEYSRTRHNAGFIALDSLAEEFGASWKSHTRFDAQIAEVHAAGEKVLFVKPLRYYNETGHVARALIDFYKLNPGTDLLVLHDELALPFGTIRVRQKGSDAGNNGIKSLTTHIGETYWRLRIGIAHTEPSPLDDAAFVLATFSAQEYAQLLELAVGRIHELTVSFIAGNLEHSSYVA